MEKPTLLDMVRERLKTVRGAAMIQLAKDTGMSYDSVLRIRENKADPAYSKVQRLADHFGIGLGRRKPKHVNSAENVPGMQ